MSNANPALSDPYPGPRPMTTSGQFTKPKVALIAVLFLAAAVFTVLSGDATDVAHKGAFLAAELACLVTGAGVLVRSLKKHLSYIPEEVGQDFTLALLDEKGKGVRRVEVEGGVFTVDGPRIKFSNYRSYDGTPRSCRAAKMDKATGMKGVFDVVLEDGKLTPVPVS